VPLTWRAISVRPWDPVTPEDAEADKFQDKLEKDIESDLGKNTVWRSKLNL